MPTHLTLAKKNIVINAKTQEILKIYNEVLDKNLKTNEVEHKDNKLSPGIEQLHGSFARLFEKIASPFADIKIGGNASKLPEIELDIDAPAYLIWESYVEFWNDLVKKEHIGPAETENENLQSAFALVRELFIRLAAVALSDNTKWKIGGERMIRLIHSFSEEIEKANSLDPAPNKLSDLKKEFLFKHHAWISDIKNAASAVELIHTNTEAISNTLQYLYDLRNTIMRLLIAELDNNKNTTDLSENWIKRTLQECELSFIRKCREEGKQANHTITHEINTVQFLVECGKIEEESASRQEQVIILGAAFSGAGHNRIRRLYNILNRTNVILFMASQLDILFTIGGWIPLLTRAIKIENFTILLREHREFCAPILTESSTSIQQTTANILKGLKHYNALSLVKIRDDKVIIQLEKLENPVLITKLKSGILTSMQSLSKAEITLGYQSKIIDVRQIDTRVTESAIPIRSSSDASFLQTNKDMKKAPEQYAVNDTGNNYLTTQARASNTKASAGNDKKSPLAILPIIEDKSLGSFECIYKGRHMYFDEFTTLNADDNIYSIFETDKNELLEKILFAATLTERQGNIIRSMLVDVIQIAIDNKWFQISDDKMQTYKVYAQRSQQTDNMQEQLARLIREKFSGNKELSKLKDETVIQWANDNQTCKNSLGDQILLYSKFKLERDSLLEKICLDPSIIKLFFLNINSTLEKIDAHNYNKLLAIFAEVENINLIIWVSMNSSKLDVYYTYISSEQPASETKHLLLKNSSGHKNRFSELALCNKHFAKQNKSVDNLNKSTQTNSSEATSNSSLDDRNILKQQDLAAVPNLTESLPISLKLTSQANDMRRNKESEACITSIISLPNDKFAYAVETKSVGRFLTTSRNAVYIVSEKEECEIKYDNDSNKPCTQLLYNAKEQLLIIGCEPNFHVFKLNLEDKLSYRRIFGGTGSQFAILPNSGRIVSNYRRQVELTAAGKKENYKFLTHYQTNNLLIYAKYGTILGNKIFKLTHEGNFAKRIVLESFKSNEYILTTGDDGNLILLDANNLQTLKIILCENPYTILPNGNLVSIISLESEQYIRITNHTNNNYDLWEGYTGITRVCCDIDGMMILVKHNKILVCETNRGKPIKHFDEVSTHKITAVAATSDNALLIGDSAGNIKRLQLLQSQNNPGSNPNALFSSHQSVKSSEQQSTVASTQNATKNSIR